MPKNKRPKKETSTSDGPSGQSNAPLGAKKSKKDETTSSTQTHGSSKTKRRTLTFESTWSYYDEQLADATKDEIKKLRVLFVKVCKSHFSKLV